MRSRRILDREKTHKLKYLRAHYFFKNCTPGITNITSLVFPIEKTSIWPRGEQWRTLVWCVTSTVQQWNSLSLFTNKKNIEFCRAKRRATEFEVFFYSWKDSPRSTAALWTLLTLVSATVLHSAKFRFSQSEILVTLFIVLYTWYNES